MDPRDPETRGDNEWQEGSGSAWLLACLLMSPDVSCLPGHRQFMSV